MSTKPSYLIETDPRRSYMRLTFSGLMDHGTVDRFEDEITAAIARMPSKDGRPGDCLFLSDVRDAGVQSRDISERLQAIMARYGPLTRRTALLVSGSALEMMQVRRVAGMDGTAFFKSEGEALAWLFEDRPSVPAVQ